MGNWREDIFGLETYKKDQELQKVQEEKDAKIKGPEPAFFDIFNVLCSGNPGKYKETHDDKPDVRDWVQTTGALPSTYSAYMMGKAFANFFDTVLWANEWNIRYQMPDFAQYILFLGAIKKKRRFTSWFKETKDETISAIAELFGWTVKEARANYDNIPKEIIDELETKLAKLKKQNKR